MSNIGKSHKVWLDSDFEKLKKMIEQGYSKATIARHFGVSTKTIYNKIKESRERNGSVV